jgi:putative membrane protein
MLPAGKPSDHLANERTFLAWTRTSISVIVFGFVVAKFGITLRQLLSVEGRGKQQSGVSLAIGIMFMAVGVFTAVMALLRYHQTRHRLNSGEFKPANGSVMLVGGITAIFGVILAVYLLLTARSL